MLIMRETSQQPISPYFSVAGAAFEQYSTTASLSSWGHGPAKVCCPLQAGGGNGARDGGLWGGGLGKGGGGEGEGGGGEGDGGGGLGEGGNGGGGGGGGL